MKKILLFIVMASISFALLPADGLDAVVINPGEMADIYTYQGNYESSLFERVFVSSGKARTLYFDVQNNDNDYLSVTIAAKEPTTNFTHSYQYYSLYPGHNGGRNSFIYTEIRESYSWNVELMINGILPIAKVYFIYQQRGL